ncbi:MAG: homocysteine S-methyltransferase family protein [Candidatus Aminicenantes bacterium]|nr:homocysteine S-methyltransferase family protein [Candidatus Aminicenantes bacterium]
MTPGILDLAKARTVLLDGALGTELILRGLPQGIAPETWNVDRPELVQEVHRSYYAAGADAVSTNSFGGSRIKLAGHGQADRTFELNKAAAELACAVRPAGKYVLGSIGPTGKFLEPQGDLSEADLGASFSEQARGLAAGGADAFILETHYDLREALCALRAAKAVAPLPVLAAMTFNATPRGFFTMMGDDVERSVKALEAAGASAVGANCSLDSAQMVGLARALRRLSALPVIIQANAGQATLGEDGRVVYSQGPDAYLRSVPEILAAGVNLIGGCCGTNPEIIRRMAGLIFRRA